MSAPPRSREVRSRLHASDDLSVCPKFKCEVELDFTKLTTVKCCKRPHQWEPRGSASLRAAAMFAWSARPCVSPACISRRVSHDRASTSTSARQYMVRAIRGVDDKVDTAILDAEKEKTREAVESAWRKGGCLDGCSKESVGKTVRGTIAVARHYKNLIEQQKFNFGKYGTGNVFPDDFFCPEWVAGQLTMISKMTGVRAEDTCEMVQVAGASVLELTASSIMRTMFELKKLIPNADSSHMVRIEPDLLIVGSTDLESIKFGGASTMATLRQIPEMPEPCVRLLVYEEPGLLLGKGGVLRLEQIRETAEEHSENLAATCVDLSDEEWLDVNAQRWFTNVFCGYY